MSLSPLLDRYAVFGNPVAHSKSPVIHRLFAEQTEQSLQYTALLAPLDNFVLTATAFFAGGGRGCNITVPFKRDAWEMAAVRSDYAERAGALNTLMMQEDGLLYGHNTDGLGLLRDLQVNQRIGLEGRRVLLLGAGGAVRGVLQPLLEANPAEVFIANRTVETAVGLADDFSEFGAVSGGGFADAGAGYDLIINGTAASLQGEVPELPAGVLQTGGVCYDMMYSPEPTAFVRWGVEQGAALSVDGLGMLVEQAAESFLLWRGVRPDTALVLEQLRR